MEINVVAVFIAALVPFFLGYLWYTIIFNKPWMKEIGMSEEEAKVVQQRDFAKQIGGSFILEIFMAVILSLLLGKDADAGKGLLWGLLIGITVAFSFGVNYLFEGRTMKHWFINAGYNVILFTLMGIIIGAM